MSDIPPGPGYWRASDGNWYPPEAHPDAQSAAAGAQSPATPDVSNPDQAGYEARLDIDVGESMARWRPFVHWIMVIPHVIIAQVLAYAAQVAAIISWFVILFTGKFPAGLHNFIAMTLRYSNRTYGFMLLLTEEYPPFDFETTPDDRTPYPIRSSYRHEAEGRNRVTVFFRFIMVIPIGLFVLVMMIAAYFVYIVHWFGVIFTGRPVLANFLCSVGRLVNRASAYAYLLSDDYPPFNLE